MGDRRRAEGTSNRRSAPSCHKSRFGSPADRQHRDPSCSRTGDFRTRRRAARPRHTSPSSKRRGRSRTGMPRCTPRRSAPKECTCGSSCSRRRRGRIGHQGTGRSKAEGHTHRPRTGSLRRIPRSPCYLPLRRTVLPRAKAVGRSPRQRRCSSRRTRGRSHSYRGLRGRMRRRH